MNTEAQITAIKQWIAVEREQNQTEYQSIMVESYNKALGALEGQLRRLEDGYKCTLKQAQMLDIPELIEGPREAIHAMAKALGWSMTPEERPNERREVEGA